MLLSHILRVQTVNYIDTDTVPFL